MLVSFNLICQNEEFFIRQYLNYVLKLGNRLPNKDFEIIIVDSGSTDKTIDIIKSYNNEKIKLFNFPWQGDFSASRNYAKEKSSGVWIFYLDADEVLSDGIFTRIEGLLRVGSNVNTYSFPKLHLIQNTKRIVDIIDRDPGIRIFRNIPEFTWKGKIENLFYRNIGVIQHPASFNFPWELYVGDIFLVHFSHLRPREALIEKYVKRSKIEGTQFYLMSKEQIIAMVDGMPISMGKGPVDMVKGITFYNEVGI